MPVRFNFVLTDEDAENLIDLIEEAKASALFESKFNTIPATRAWYASRATYLDDLKSKVLKDNTRES